MAKAPKPTSAPVESAPATSPTVDGTSPAAPVESAPTSPPLQPLYPFHLSHPVRTGREFGVTAQSWTPAGDYAIVPLPSGQKAGMVPADLQHSLHLVQQLRQRFGGGANQLLAALVESAEMGHQVGETLRRLLAVLAP